MIEPRGPVVSAARSKGWILALATAVVFPAAALHLTCVAVMGPGTWGSGLDERPPDFAEPGPAAQQYRLELDAAMEAPAGAERSTAGPVPEGLDGELQWSHGLEGQSLYLVRSDEDGTVTQRLYVRAGEGRVEEVALPPGDIVERPQWTREGIAYVRWNPWAISPAKKLRRYFASWFSPSLRPEASVYLQSRGQLGWRYVMPGHSLTVSPDGRRAALLRSGALLAGYYSVHIWEVGSPSAPGLFSLRERGDEGARSFRLRWSQDSSALFVAGRTGGFDRRASRSPGEAAGIPLALVYFPTSRALWDLSGIGPRG